MEGCKRLKLSRSPVKFHPQRFELGFKALLMILNFSRANNHLVLFFPWQLQYPLRSQFANTDAFLTIHPEMHPKGYPGVGIFIA